MPLIPGTRQDTGAFIRPQRKGDGLRLYGSSSGSATLAPSATGTYLHSSPLAVNDASPESGRSFYTSGIAAFSSAAGAWNAQGSVCEITHDSAGARIRQRTSGFGLSLYGKTDGGIERLGLQVNKEGIVKLGQATASRLLGTDGTNQLVSTSLSAWLDGTANQIVRTDDGDGTVTLSLPNMVSLGTAIGEKLRVYNGGTPDASYGFGIGSGQLQIFSAGNNSASVVSFGDLSAAGAFTEYVKIETGGTGRTTFFGDVRIDNATNQTLQFRESSIDKWHIARLQSGNRLAIVESGAADRVVVSPGGATSIAGSGGSHPEGLFQITKPGLTELTIRNQTEAVGQLATLRFATGSGTLSSNNSIAAIYSEITQANPSALKGRLNFYTNRGDALTIAAILDDAGLFGLNRFTSLDAMVDMIINDPTRKGLRIQGASAQADDYIHIMDVAASDRFRVASNGVTTISSTGAVNRTFGITSGASGSRMIVAVPEALNNFADYTFSISIDGVASSQTIAHIRGSISAADPNPLQTTLGFFVNAGDSVVNPVSITATALALANAVDIAISTTTGSKIGTSATQKIGFWGATPIVRPAANPDTSGATLPQLETEVNELKQLLRNVGLMAA